MLGPKVEKNAIVRHVFRMFVTRGGLSVPRFAYVLRRRGNGSGARTTMVSHFTNGSFFIAARRIRQFGGMLLEAYVRLGLQRDGGGRRSGRARRVLQDCGTQSNGPAESTASLFEIDHAIDPVETRRWIEARGPGALISQLIAKNRVSMPVSSAAFAVVRHGVAGVLGAST